MILISSSMQLKIVGLNFTHVYRIRKLRVCLLIDPFEKKIFPIFFLHDLNSFISAKQAVGKNA
jgi:hypothetical protein